MPLVTVVMPARNAGRFLPGVFQMLAPQKGGFELIVTSNASTDGTEEMFRSLAADCDFPCVLLTTDKMGVSLARNMGMDRAGGDYVAFADADDELKADYISSLCAFADRGDFDVLLFRHERGGRPARKALGGDGFVSPAELARRILVSPDRYGIYDILVRRSFLVEHAVRFDETLRYFEDYAFLFSLLAARPRVLCTDRVLYASAGGEFTDRFEPERFREQGLPGGIQSDAVRLMGEEGRLVPAGLYRDILRTCARRNDYRAFRLFAKETGAREKMKTLCRGCALQIRAGAGLYRLSPGLYYAAVRLGSAKVLMNRKEKKDQ